MRFFNLEKPEWIRIKLREGRKCPFRYGCFERRSIKCSNWQGIFSPEQSRFSIPAGTVSARSLMPAKTTVAYTDGKLSMLQVITPRIVLVLLHKRTGCNFMFKTFLSEREKLSEIPGK